MGFFGVVRVNGVPRFGMPIVVTDGSANSPSIGFASQPGLGWYRSAANQIALANSGASTPPPVSMDQGINISASGQLVWTGSSATAAGTAVLRQEAANTFKFYDGTTNASTVLLGAVDFRQTASTFAQTATITNGPRAANPVAWVEVKVLGSTGRVPVW